ncbi:hypothetical protein AWM79_22950 [Pseudomonas agarici]|uniref:Uncharacterized protein n=1 Tax=Pseudomonas agarici TaxID=46677 RepID=A0A0X1T777_PSEAA|nr:hypothetical protein AWM79_22950 [Pseudomonas agarici]
MNEIRTRFFAMVSSHGERMTICLTMSWGQAFYSVEIEDLFLLLPPTISKLPNSLRNVDIIFSPTYEIVLCTFIPSGLINISTK